MSSCRVMDDDKLAACLANVHATHRSERSNTDNYPPVYCDVARLLTVSRNTRVGVYLLVEEIQDEGMQATLLIIIWNGRSEARKRLLADVTNLEQMTVTISELSRWIADAFPAISLQLLRVAKQSARLPSEPGQNYRSSLSNSQQKTPNKLLGPELQYPKKTWQTMNSVNCFRQLLLRLLERGVVQAIICECHSLCNTKSRLMAKQLPVELRYQPDANYGSAELFCD
uniref:Resolvase n=1 Tax=Ascaris lumbricoides TaxID=6252 RepID=A0A0M3HWH5_ASCLU